MRVFVALLPSLASIEKIKPLCVEGFPSHHASDLHMTLYFLGKSSHEQVLALMGELASSTMHKAVKWRVDRQGWFPSERQPKVWALHGNMGESLQQGLDQLASLPSLILAREFRPHVTLNPCGPSVNTTTMSQNMVCFKGEIIFDRLALMQSVSGGATRYQTLWQRELV